MARKSTRATRTSRKTTKSKSKSKKTKAKTSRKSNTSAARKTAKARTSTPTKPRRSSSRSRTSARQRRHQPAELEPIVRNEPAPVHLPDRAIHAPGKRHRTPPPHVTAFTKAAPHVAKLRIAADARNRRG